MARRPRNAPERPTKQQILAYIEEAPGRIGKREIARAFHLHGSDRIWLKEILRELESDGYPIIDNDMPLMVMVDAGSASASEIMASALQDYERALIVGDRTFGKATVQQIQPLETRAGMYLIKLTIARYYAPNGYTVQVHGVQPDIRISDQKDGEFPLRFREEDMWHHLPELAQKDPNPRREKWIDGLKKQVNPKQAEKYLKEHENDAVRPDYMLQRALPYLKAMIAEKD